MPFIYLSRLFTSWIFVTFSKSSLAYGPGKYLPRDAQVAPLPEAALSRLSKDLRKLVDDPKVPLRSDQARAHAVR